MLMGHPLSYLLTRMVFLGFYNISLPSLVRLLSLTCSSHPPFLPSSFLSFFFSPYLTTPLPFLPFLLLHLPPFSYTHTRIQDRMRERMKLSEREGATAKGKRRRRRRRRRRGKLGGYSGHGGLWGKNL